MMFTKLMRKLFWISPVLFGCLACSVPKKDVDLLVMNGHIYTLTSDSSQAEAMVISEGKVVATGTTVALKRQYAPKEILDLKGAYAYPGWIDPHAHFYGLGQSLFNADLRGVTSEEDMLQRLQEFTRGKSLSVVYGRGWDQNLWPDKQFPTKEKLDALYPDVPVLLSRVDGHAALVNQKALDMAGIHSFIDVHGGSIEVNDGKLTGILIDNAVDLVASQLPKPTREEQTEMLLAAQQRCFEYGLTSVSDAGVEKEIIDLYNALQQEGKLKIRIYAMANPTAPTLPWLLQNGPLHTDRLHVQSVKYYMDGAMGSRGACLLSDYSDKPGHKGFLLNWVDSLRTLAQQLYTKKIQLNVHCIGDSANRVTLQIMKQVLGKDSTARWRIEHVQLLSPVDMDYFRGGAIIGSMQPTHATSDAEWVDERLGADRLPYAYALRSVLEAGGRIALGTDFPVEEVNPLYTFYAATERKHPLTGYTAAWLQPQALTRLQTLKGMTIWAAYAQFEENEKGSLEPGKWADFVVYEEDLMKMPAGNIPGLKPRTTYIGGEKVFSRP